MGDRRSISPKIKMERSISAIQANNLNDAISYTLPDGTCIGLSDWMCDLPELLFADYHSDFENDLMDEWIEQMKQMDYANRNKLHTNDDAQCKYKNERKVWEESDYERFRFKGCGPMIVESLNDCDVDIRSLVMKNVVIAGGNSLYKGMIERIGKNLSETVPFSYKYKLQINDTPRERLFSVWLGGSILCSASCFEDMWITKEEYAECGKASIVHRKCLWARACSHSIVQCSVSFHRILNI